MTKTAVLVTAAQAGDREAFGRLYELYGRMVHGILLARVPRCDVEDLTQEVFPPWARPAAGVARPRGLRRLIQALPEAYREPLVLRLVEGMTGPEIAERTGLTPGSVRVNLLRGYEMLRARLTDER